MLLAGEALSDSSVPAIATRSKRCPIVAAVRLDPEARARQPQEIPHLDRALLALGLATQPREGAL